MVAAPGGAADLRAVLAGVPDDLFVARDRRPEQVIGFCLRLCQAMDGWLRPSRSQASPGPEYHFHCTHDDLGFALAIGGWQLVMDACQASMLLITMQRGGELVEELRIPLSQVTPERARSEILAFADLALQDAAAASLAPRVRWLSHPDPARRPSLPRPGGAGRRQ